MPSMPADSLRDTAARGLAQESRLVKRREGRGRAFAVNVDPAGFKHPAWSDLGRMPSADKSDVFAALDLCRLRVLGATCLFGLFSLFGACGSLGAFCRRFVALFLPCFLRGPLPRFRSASPTCRPPPPPGCRPPPAARRLAPFLLPPPSPPPRQARAGLGVVADPHAVDCGRAAPLYRPRGLFPVPDGPVEDLRLAVVASVAGQARVWLTRTALRRRPGLRNAPPRAFAMFGPPSGAGASGLRPTGRMPRPVGGRMPAAFLAGGGRAAIQGRLSPSMGAQGRIFLPPTLGRIPPVRQRPDRRGRSKQGHAHPGIYLASRFMAALRTAGQPGMPGVPAASLHGSPVKRMLMAAPAIGGGVRILPISRFAASPAPRPPPPPSSGAARGRLGPCPY